MSDPKATLNPAQIREAGLDDWRQVLGRIKARFRTGDFATGLKLVNLIGESAEQANHHPDVSLSYTDVIVALASHDVDGITSRDIDLAQQISAHAKTLGVEADVHGITQVELGLDTATGDGSRLGEFYAALLGGEIRNGEPVDPSGQVPTVWWQGPGEGERDEFSLPAQEFEQRWHLDVWVPHDEGERRMQAALDAGGTLVSDKAAPSYWVIEDADGNRACICTPLDR